MGNKFLVDQIFMFGRVTPADMEASNGQGRAP